MGPLFTNRYRHIGRYREIVNILSKHGLGHILDLLGLNIHIGAFWRKKEIEETPATTAQRLRMVFEELGPTFIKLGQILSTRPDLLPPVYISQLELLQDRVPPVSFEEIKAAVEDQLGQPITEIFMNLSEMPLASASIGQVHEGYLLSGEHVVIKAQRASVERIVETDLEIMYDVARLLEARTGWGKFYKIVQMVDEFAKSIKEELNYIVEARNAQKLADNLKGDPRIRIPKVYWEFSTRRILILEFVAGIKITACQELDEAGIDKAEVGRRLANSILKQLLFDGFFHADPHPGNIAVDQEKRIVFMDFGMVGRLDEWMKDRLGAMLFNIASKDVNGIVRVLIEIGDPQKKVNKQRLKRDIYRLFDKYYNRPLEEIKIGQALRELLGLSFDYRIRVPVELVLMIRSLILLEGAVECLAPQVSIVELAEPFGKKLMREKLSPENVGKAVLSYMFELSAISSSFPRHLDNLIQTLEEGELKVTLEHQNFNKLVSRVNLLGNRISFSLIVASIIVGSSLVAQRSPKSLLWKLPIAEAGFVIAVLLGLWLLVSIIRSRKI